MEVDSGTEIVENNSGSDIDQPSDSPNEVQQDRSYVDVKLAGTLKYPYGAMVFMMTATVGLGLTSGGVISILEFYFTHFLFVCVGKLAVGLGTASLNIFLTLTSLSGFFGGFQADKLLGSFVSHIISYVISAIGTFLLALSTWMYTLSPPACCYDPTNATDMSYENCSAIATSITLKGVDIHVPSSLSITLAMIGLVTFAIGNGQLWLQSVFVGDQFDDKRQVNEQQRAFAWFYFWMSFGTLVGDLGLPILRQTTGYVIAYLAIAGAAIISMIVFLSGRRLYVKKSPQRAICTSTMSCSSCQKSRRLCTDSMILLNLDSTEGESDVDKENSSENCTEDSSNTSKDLGVQTTDQSPTNSPSHALVEARDSKSSAKGKLKQLIPIFKIFVPLTLFWAIFFQRSSTWIVQATHMDCYLGSLHVPPDVMPSIEDVMVLLNVPILEYLLYPHFRRSMELKIKPMHKLVCGMIATTLSFFLAGLLQVYITEPSEECRGDVSIAWQLPQLFLLSVGDVLVGITGLEVAYSLAPLDLRNTVTSLYYIVQAIGTLINAAMALIPMSLLSSFFIYSGMILVATIIFAIMNRKIDQIYTLS